MAKIWTRIKLPDGRASEGSAENPQAVAQVIANNTGLLVNYCTADVKGTWKPWIEVYPQGIFSWVPPGFLDLKE